MAAALQFLSLTQSPLSQIVVQGMHTMVAAVVVAVVVEAAVVVAVESTILILEVGVVKVAMVVVGVGVVVEVDVDVVVPKPALLALRHYQQHRSIVCRVACGTARFFNGVGCRVCTCNICTLRETIFTESC